MQIYKKVEIYGNFYFLFCKNKYEIFYDNTNIFCKPVRNDATNGTNAFFLIVVGLCHEWHEITQICTN